nr:MAG TPA: RNA polymerase sigma factor [Caudoviricetes sp.]
MTALEKLKMYDEQIAQGCSVEELKKIRQKIYKVDTYFDNEAYCEKELLLQCIKEIIEDSK